MKKIAIFFVLIILPFYFFAAPFGLKMGMTLDEVTEACGGTKPVHIEDNCYQIYPTKTHPLFKQYAAFVDSERGLYCIKAVSEEISTNDYGTEIKNAFSEIENRIAKTYGKSRKIDELSDDYYAKSEQYWVSQLSKGARTYAAIWESTSKSQLKDDLDSVVIYANAKIFPQTGWIILEYDFNNMQAVEDAQDDVF